MNQQELDQVLTKEQKAAGLELKVIQERVWLIYGNLLLRNWHHASIKNQPGSICAAAEQYLLVYQAGFEDGREEAQYTIGDWHKPA